MQLRSVLRILCWSAGALAFAGLVVLAVVQRNELLRLRAAAQGREADLKELDRLHAEVKEAEKLRNQQVEIQQLREDNKDLFRMRNEIGQLRQQQAEVQELRTANAELLQALQGVTLNSNQEALVTTARRRGAVLGINAVSADDPQLGPAAPRYRGAVVMNILPDSPVARSDLKARDIIVRVDGRPIESASQLQAEMLTRKPGESVALDVIRDNAPRRVIVQLRAWPQ
jgi:C-terminal processing protease CtpA/Prc